MGDFYSEENMKELEQRWKDIQENNVTFVEYTIEELEKRLS